MPDAYLESLVRSKEYEYNLPDNLLYNLVSLESGFNPNATSKAGAKGLTQIIQKYHPEVSNPYNPEENLTYAAKTLRSYADKFGSWQAAVAAWHAGPGRVSASLNSGGDGIPDTTDVVTGLKTRNYVKRILQGVSTDYTGLDETPINTGGLALQDRPFDRYSLGVIGLGAVFLGALVLAFKD